MEWERVLGKWSGQQVGVLYRGGHEQFEVKVSIVSVKFIYKGAVGHNMGFE